MKSPTLPARMAHQQGYMHLIGTYPNSSKRSSSNKLSMFVNNAPSTMVQLKMHDPNSTKAWTGSLGKNIMQLIGERSGSAGVRLRGIHNESG